MDNQNQLAKNGQMPLKSCVVDKDGDKKDIFEISVYNDQLTPQNIGKYTIELINAFPDIKTEFLEGLKQAILRNKFTDDRFKDAVHNLIDTYHYTVPKIADIISYDNRVRLYTYNEVLNYQAWTDRMPFTDVFKCTEYSVGGKKLWAKITDLQQFNLL